MKFTHAAIALAALTACPTALAAQRPPQIAARLEQALTVPDTSLVRSHIHFLSSALLDERLPGSAGAMIAAQYVAAQFEALGLEPAEADHSFLRPFELVGVDATGTLTIGAHGRTVILEPEQEFVAWPERAAEVITADGELVFAGYGIRAPERGRDDYQGAALGGQIVLLLAGEPDDDVPTATNGRQHTRYGTWRYKLDQAARMGARGVLLVRSDGDPVPWDEIVRAWGGEKLFFDRPAESNLEFGAWLTEAAARRLLAASDRDLDLLVRRAALPNFRPIPVGSHAVAQFRGALSRILSANVVARLSGSDPDLVQESVVLLAPYDNPSVAPAIRKDDGSGIAAVLGAAAGLARGGVVPRRSVLFVATGATGVDHLGSRSLVEDPAVPIEGIAGFVSLRGADGRGATTEFVALGADQSDLGGFVRLAAAQERGTVNGADPGGWFLRMDHLPFAEAGVPSVAVGSGGEAPSGSATFTGLAQQARLLMRLAFLIGEANAFPEWATDSEFRPASDRLRVRRRGRIGSGAPGK